MKNIEVKPYQFNRPIQPKTLEERINIFMPFEEVPKPPANLPLWEYWNKYFREKFLNDSGLNIIYYHSAEELAGDLVARFGGKFDIAQIRRCLELDYTIKHSRFKYAMRREDFIKPITQ